jgi:hypothetical protein
MVAGDADVGVTRCSWGFVMARALDEPWSGANDATESGPINNKITTAGSARTARGACASGRMLTVVRRSAVCGGVSVRSTRRGGIHGLER